MENSTPSEEKTLSDTSEVKTADTPETGAEPTVATTEPESGSSGAEQTNNNPTEQLIFGKYKNIEEAEKGYKEAERAVTKAAELEKQLKAYQDKEEQAQQQREIAARELGYSDANEQEVRLSIARHEFKRYCDALETRLSGDNYTKAYNALYAYQQSGNRDYLDMAKGYFPASVISLISGDVALYSERALNEYRDRKALETQQQYKAQLEAFAKDNTEWLAPKERQDAVGLLIQLSGGNVDFATAKAAIDALEAYAVSEYTKKQSENQENQNVQNSLLSPTGGNVSSGDKKWLTKEEYYNLTPEQEKANYDLIAEQILLEKQGKLPKMLT